MLVWVLMLLGDAQAAPDGEPPLAIPADAPRPPSVLPPPTRLPGPPPSSAGAREYRSRHLELRHLSQLVQGTTWSYGYSGRGGPSWGWRGGWVAWPHPWAVQIDTLAVFEGELRLDVPDTFRALGDVPGQQVLSRKIRNQRRSASALYGLGVAGVATSVVGLIGMDQSLTFEARRSWSGVGLAGMGLTAVGFVSGSFPSGKARRLQYEHVESFDLTDLRSRINSHNERLAASLGLAPAEALQLER